MASKYKNMTIEENDHRTFRQIKLEYMGYIGESNLSDGKCILEFSKLIKDLIKLQKIQVKK